MIRFIRFGVNVRFFNIQGTEDMLIDTVGMSTLFLPDVQYHFHGMDPNWVVNHRRASPFAAGAGRQPVSANA